MKRRKINKDGSIALLEADVATPIVDFLELRQWRVFRTDVVRAASTRGFIATGQTGQPDYVAIHPRLGHLLIETKRPVGGKLSDKQIQWHLCAAKDGLTVLVPRTFEEFEAMYWQICEGAKA